MQSTFVRALLGFLTLSMAIIFMSSVVLWALSTYAPDATWASILVLLLAMISIILIYGTTLHDPIYQWIREPSKLAARQAAIQEQEARERNAQGLNPKTR